jgi:hypothetical protein
MADMLGARNEDVGALSQLEEQPMDPEKARYLRLELKRRHKMQLIKKMLEEAGYGDLAKMTTVKSRELEGY